LRMGRQNVFLPPSDVRKELTSPSPNNDDDEEGHGVSKDDMTRLENLLLTEDKSEAAIAMQPETMKSLLPGSRSAPVGNLDPESVEEIQGSSSVDIPRVASLVTIQEDGDIQDTLSTAAPVEGDPLSSVQVDQLVKRFNLEGRNRRSLLKARVHDVWSSRRNGLVPDHLSNVHHELDSFLARRLGRGGIMDVNVVFDEFLALQLHQFDLVLRENKQVSWTIFIVV
jgi:hypothetical protein